MFAELTLFIVFSVDLENSKMVITKGIGQNYILTIDKDTQCDKMIFQKVLDRKLSGENVSVEVEGEINKGILKARRIKS